MTDKDRKLAEEILNDIMFEHYKIKFVSIENASSSLLTLRSFGIWKAMLKAMEEYAEQRIREELMKFMEFLTIDKYQDNPDIDLINEYLKQKK